MQRRTEAHNYTSQTHTQPNLADGNMTSNFHRTGQLHTSASPEASRRGNGYADWPQPEKRSRWLEKLDEYPIISTTMYEKYYGEITNPEYLRRSQEYNIQQHAPRSRDELNGVRATAEQRQSGYGADSAGSGYEYDPPSNVRGRCNGDFNYKDGYTKGHDYQYRQESGRYGATDDAQDLRQYIQGLAYTQERGCGGHDQHDPARQNGYGQHGYYDYNEPEGNVQQEYYGQREYYDQQEHYVQQEDYNQQDNYSEEDTYDSTCEDYGFADEIYDQEDDYEAY